MLSLTHVTKVFGSVIGVNDVTVELGSGAHGLLGPNGAGKTTLLGLITGQLRPTMGQVRVFGERPFSNPRVLRRIGFCPAADLLERRATPREWVRYLVRLSGFGPRAAAERANRELDRVGLGEALDRPLSTLSKGMRQRAKLAGAMAHGPDLLVLDEPFDGLDPVARHDLVTLVRHWAVSSLDGFVMNGGRGLKLRTQSDATALQKQGIPAICEGQPRLMKPVTHESRERSLVATPSRP